MRRFAPGDSVVWRSVDQENRIVQTVWPWTVVKANEDGIVLFIPAGTVGKRRTGERGGPGDRFIVRWDGGQAETTWERTNVVRSYREGDAHSVWFAFDATTWVPVWRFVNLEDPWLRTPIGFDSRDLYLDLYADPACDEWHWKDEDELEWVVAQGRIDATRVAAIRAEGERAVARVRGVPEFGVEWRGWRPNPGWAIPTLPPRGREYEPSSQAFPSGSRNEKERPPNAMSVGSPRMRMPSNPLRISYMASTRGAFSRFNASTDPLKTPGATATPRYFS